MFAMFVGFSMIDLFTGDYEFLSNFYNLPKDIEYEGQKYSSTEHAFQAAKTLSHKDRKPFTISGGINAGTAKRMGRKISLRSDWEKVKISIMRDVLRLKFAIPELRTKLLATGNHSLVEGNTWGDRIWGVCKGKGQNLLGKLLMEIREEIRKEHGFTQIV